MTRTLTQEIPAHLATYIVQQDPSLYTPMDHASWRYIMKISQAFFSTAAHEKYLYGLRETGITTDRIPLIEEMDQRLRKFGWRAVGVSGFIPPAIFMEFLAKGILAIACDMRKIENLNYTPAPDIVHEAAGHAPIIADPEYADYLNHYGELAEKAIFSSQDLEVYEAIKNLSDTKEDPFSTPEMIAAAQKRLNEATSAVTHDSEATQLGRMGWWTIEYGLIGSPTQPRIYGAGLLSSVSESFDCLDESVKKVPFSVDCVDVSFDITRPQPQLFLSPDFQTLKEGLKEFSNRMAYKRGGEFGLNKAIQAQTTTTAMLDSGIQMSGTLVECLKDSKGNTCYLRYQGPSQLSFKDIEIDNQGPRYHAQGFSTPIGRLKGSGKSPAELKPEELKNLTHLEFESGVTVQGKLVGSLSREGRNLILTFENCTVKMGERILFQPDWGNFDLACGEKVTSVYGHAADRRRYLEATDGLRQIPGKPKTNLTPLNAELNTMYQHVRKIRETGLPKSQVESAEAEAVLAEIHNRLEVLYPDDWLLRYELLELDSNWKLHSPWGRSARSRLELIARSGSRQSHDTIMRGLALIQ